MPTTDFYFGIVLLAAMLLTISSWRPRCITCPCGSMVNSKKYTHCVLNAVEVHTCKIWANCKTCEANSTHCLTCPEGRKGPTCAKEQKIFCRYPGVKPNSRLFTSFRRDRIFALGSQLVYVCNDGYKTKDLQVVKCLISGQWSSPPPTCDKIVPKANPKVFCRYPSVRPNSILITSINRGQVFLPKTQLIYVCSKGYQTMDPLILKCLISGEWSSPPPNCNRIASKEKRRIFCKYPKERPNSKVVTSARRDHKFPAGVQLLYVCDEGYKTRNPPVIKCLNSGKWSFPPPTCTKGDKKTSTKKYSCAYPDMDLTGMTVEAFPNITDKREMFPPGSQISFDCERGYELVGNEWIIFCSGRGKWTSNPPTCKPLPTINRKQSRSATTFTEIRKGCPNPKVDRNGVMEDIPANDLRRRGEEFEPGSRVNFTCNDGYKMKGKSVIICLRNGQWNSYPPKCRRDQPAVKTPPSELAECTDLGSIANGWITAFDSTLRARRRPSFKPYKYPEGTKLAYECFKGFNLQGKKQLTCKSTGEWSGNKPTCVAGKLTNLSL